MKMFLRCFGQLLHPLFGALTLTLSTGPSTLGQGTAFTYQGRLNDATGPANGNYEIKFSAFNALALGNLVAGPVTNAPVAVSNGVFVATLNFGPGIFAGAPRWLEIAVRPSGDTTDFTTLAPRQPILPTPYAIYSGTAATVPNGSITAAKLSAGAASANLQAAGQSAVGGGGVVLSEQPNATELLSLGYQKMGRANLIDETWLSRLSGPTGLPAPLMRRGHSAVWTGSEMIIWGGTDENGALLNTGARYNPSSGIWTRISTSNAPAARTGHRAIWTGSQMIVWGGNAVAPFVLGGTMITNTGARYNLATDSWTPIAAGGGSRQNHTAFWTGTEMLIWGGSTTSSGIFGANIIYLTSGARYNLAANTWTAIPSSTGGAPVSRTDYSAVFTGTDMILWGGSDVVGSFIGTLTNFNDGARYNLAANTWTPLSLAGAPTRRFGHSAVWTGTEMIVWGGGYAEGTLDIVRSNFNNGGRYNPAANSWSPLSVATGTPTARYGHDAVWAGNRMVVWGGTDGTNTFNSGARYFPGNNTWSNMTSFGRPAGRTGHTTIFSGSEMIVWGGFNEFLRDLGGRYHPSNDIWTATSPTGERSKRRGHTAVWTGNEVLVWGGFDGERYLNTGGRYVPASNLWFALPTNGAPAGRVTHTAVWTGTEMLVWGGANDLFLNTGGRFNPATQQWSPITTNGAPTARNGHVSVWTGTQMLIWGGLDGALVNSGSRYNPVNDTWTVMTPAGAPAARSGATAVWTGTEMLVWGGSGGTVPTPFALASGGRYNPTANSWAALPGANAPAARTAHRAVWTGEEMIVWGGTDITSDLNTGGRYNRSANSWTALSTVGAPSPRVEHSAVWDGTRMIVWGGSSSNSTLNTGGIYNPLTDGWSATQLGTNTPPARGLHVAVWTGTEMVVHGGYSEAFFDEDFQFRDDTWHYLPPRTMYLYLKP